MKLFRTETLVRYRATPAERQVEQMKVIMELGRKLALEIMKPEWYGKELHITPRFAHVDLLSNQRFIYIIDVKELPDHAEAR